jgi:uncharacterized protein (DUF2236 family)
MVPNRPIVVVQRAPGRPAWLDGSVFEVPDVRRVIADAVRQRVVGDDGVDPGLIVDEPGPRWFADDRPIKVVHTDSSMFIGGLMALLLQSLHPLAMAGVAGHSAYRTDPWGRLQRTAAFLAVTTFGPAARAEQAVERVRRVHSHVVGVAADGRPYAASDPHLLRWVHCAEVRSFLTAHTHFGRQSLDQAGRDGYVADMAVVARALGVDAPPETERELDDQLAAYRPELRGSRAAREAARFLVLTPPVPLAARPAYRVLAASAVSLLPVWARRQLWLPWLPVTERFAVRPAGEALSHLLRWALGPPPVSTLR